MRSETRLTRAAFPAAIAVTIALSPGRASAQFDFGIGLGFQQPGSRSQQMLDGWALQNGARATMGPVQNNVYAGNPNSYVARMREPGLLERWDVDTRREIEARIGRFSDGPPPSRLRAQASPAPQPAPVQPAAPAPPAGPDLPLSSFFDRYRKLVWPGDSPVHGDLGTDRAMADLSCLAVLNDQELRGLALVGTVTEARARLVDYGRPALQYMRDNSTPRVADTFHLFIRSLYDSLGQAATVPRKPAAPPHAPAEAQP
jgi:hypothetical protein